MSKQEKKTTSKLPASQANSLKQPVTANEPVIPQGVAAIQPVQAVSLTKEQIKAQAQAQIQAIKLLEKQAKEQAKAQTLAIKEQAKNEASLIKAETLKDTYSIETQYGVMQGDDWMLAKNAMLTITSLAAWAQSSLKAKKQSEIDLAKKAKLQVELDKVQAKADELKAKLNQAVADEYDNHGNVIIDLNMPQAHADILNALADALSLDSNGTIQPVDLSSMRMTKAQQAGLKLLAEQAYIVQSGTGEMSYTFTDKGLNLFHTNWQEVQANLEGWLEQAS